MNVKGNYSQEESTSMVEAFRGVIGSIEKLSKEEQLGVVKALTQFVLMKNKIYCSYGVSNLGATILITGSLADKVKDYVDSIDHQEIANKDCEVGEDITTHN